jgi:hypothetical protein
MSRSAHAPSFSLAHAPWSSGEPSENCSSDPFHGRSVGEEFDHSSVRTLAVETAAFLVEQKTMTGFPRLCLMIASETLRFISMLHRKNSRNVSLLGQHRIKGKTIRPAFVSVDVLFELDRSKILAKDLSTGGKMLRRWSLA